MAALVNCDAGTGATGDFAPYALTTGIIASVQNGGGAPIADGERCILAVSTTATSALAAIAGPDDSGRRISFWVYIPPNMMATTQGALAAIYNSAFTHAIFILGLNADGGLTGIPEGVSGVNGTKKLQQERWYRIGLSYSITNSTTYTFKVYVDGVLDVSIVNAGALTTTGTAFFGVVVDKAWGLRGYFFGGIFIDNGSDFTDVGNVHVIAKRPRANGSSNQFTTQIGSGGAGIGTGHAPQVSEIPRSNTNGWSIASAGAKTEEYNLERQADDRALIGASIVGNLAWAMAATGAGTETALLICNGATANAALTTTPTYVIKVGPAGQYVDGAGADIGLTTDGSATQVNLYECGIQVAYIPMPRRPPEPTVTRSGVIVVAEVSVGSDAFTYSNGALTGKGNWVAQGGTNDLAIVSNAVDAGGSGNDASDYYNATFRDDQYAQVALPVVASPGLGQGYGVYLRMATGAASGYRVIANGNGTEILSFNAGTSSSVKTDTGTTWANGDVLRAEVTGQAPNIQLVVKKNGTIISAMTTTGLSQWNSGKCGVAYSSVSATGKLDDFDAGNLAYSTGGALPTLPNIRPPAQQRMM